MLSANGIKQIGASENLEQHMLLLLALSGFSKDLLQALKARCVEVIPVKKILTQAKLWHWPIDYPASFWLGLELVFIGLFFSPISRWISAGDPRTKWRHVRHMAQRPITTTRMVLQSIGIQSLRRENDCCTVTDDLTPRRSTSGSLATFAASRLLTSNQ